MRLTTFETEGQSLYGAVVEGGIVALSPDFPHWPTLREAIAGDGLHDLALAAQGRAVTHPTASFTYAIPIPAPEKIICVGVNFPARNDRVRRWAGGPAQPVAVRALCPLFHRP